MSVIDLSSSSMHDFWKMSSSKRMMNEMNKIFSNYLLTSLDCQIPESALGSASLFLQMISLLA
jgi:hypothetical protein